MGLFASDIPSFPYCFGLTWVRWSQIRPRKGIFSATSAQRPPSKTGPFVDKRGKWHSFLDDELRRGAQPLLS